MPGLNLALDEEFQAANCYGTHPWAHNGRSGILHHDGSATHWTHKSQLGSHRTIPTGLTPAKWKQTATLCPLDWPSNCSLLRLWHTTKSFHQYAAQVKQQMQHRHMCLPTGKSTARGWRVGCKTQETDRVAFQANAMNCGSMPQGREN